MCCVRNACLYHDNVIAATTKPTYLHVFSGEINVRCLFDFTSYAAVLLRVDAALFTAASRGQVTVAPLSIVKNQED